MAQSVRSVQFFVKPQKEGGEAPFHRPVCCADSSSRLKTFPRRITFSIWWNRPVDNLGRRSDAAAREAAISGRTRINGTNAPDFTHASWNPRSTRPRGPKGQGGSFLVPEMNVG